MSKNKELARLFYRELEKIEQQPSLVHQQKINAQYQLLSLLFHEATKEERIHFSTLFARITYVCQRLEFPKKLQFQIHYYRREARKEMQQASERVALIYDAGRYVIAHTIRAFFLAPIPEGILPDQQEETLFPSSSGTVSAFKPKMRVLVIQDDQQAQQLVVIDEWHPEKELRVRYNLAERNENFNPTIKAIRQHFKLPLTINLIDVEIDELGILSPRGFILEPDYLVDISTIAECFKHFGELPESYLLKKLLPLTPNIYLAIGNIANYFLDELMNDSGQTFKQLFPKVFHLNPLTFALFEDKDIMTIMQKSQKHFLNLKYMVNQGFEKEGILPSSCFLEPSFFSEKYGIQGRLDVFFHPQDGRSAIVELKSGKPFGPNKYGLSVNHFTQTLLYDLLIRSTFGNKITLTNYILYSQLDRDILKYAPTVKAQQMEALKLRNQLLTYEQQLINLLEKDELDNPPIFRDLSPGVHPKVSGFVRDDLAEFQATYQKMTQLDRHYFCAFASFIAREHKLARTGVQGINQANGQASLWLNSILEKEDQFEIISQLVLIENHSKDEEPVLRFQKTEHTNPLANFRKGDIAVLYPFSNSRDSVLTNQIFKCTILEIDEKEIVVRLRSRQFNSYLFETEPYWNLEHDQMDKSFTTMYQQLFVFQQFAQQKKNLLYTISPPGKKDSPGRFDPPSELTQEQQQIFEEIIHSNDYYLLWGPPGTGKTSKMLKNVVGHYWKQSKERLLLLAYTNRAVDEICEAIESYHPDIKQDYIRIGSRYSTRQSFRGNLLEAKTKQAKTRKDLLAVLRSQRIYVATVASINGKMELFRLLKFKRVIIDEASQILEPALVGLLPRFDHFLLIGDHNQLPAVVAQHPSESAVRSNKLKDIGLDNLRNSLFERLFKQAMNNHWDWAYGILSHQGRMHAEIMEFPNQQFYQEQLTILPEEIKVSELQQSPLNYMPPEPANWLDQLLCRERVLFLPTPIDEGGEAHKTNRHEAKLIRDLTQSFIRIYHENNLELNGSSIGIITPYRAQIAQIKKALKEENLPVEKITIDTVERYQGGSRDIILVSLCTNKLGQLASLINKSEEGVDRKLNVALTRARHHLVLVGNPDILKRDEVYGEFMKRYGAGTP